jgi:hypothetical protein
VWDFLDLEIVYLCMSHKLARIGKNYDFNWDPKTLKVCLVPKILYDMIWYDKEINKNKIRHWHMTNIYPIIYGTCKHEKYLKIIHFLVVNWII